MRVGSGSLEERWGYGLIDDVLGYGNLGFWDPGKTSDAGLFWVIFVLFLFGAE